MGVRERALLVTEQLRLDQVLGQRGAVEVHERAAGPRAAEVQGPGREVLPGPGLSLDQHRRRTLPRLTDELPDARNAGAEGAHGITRADQREVLARTLLALARVLQPPGQLRLAQRPFDLDHQLVEVHRLDQVVVGPLLHRRHGVPQPAEGGQHQHRHAGMVPGANLPQEVEARSVGQPHVEQHQVGPPAGEQGAGLGKVRGQHALHAVAAELPADRACEHLLVVDDEDRGPGAFRLAVSPGMPKCHARPYRNRTGNARAGDAWSGVTPRRSARCGARERLPGHHGFPPSRE